MSVKVLYISIALMLLTTACSPVRSGFVKQKDSGAKRDSEINEDIAKNNRSIISKRFKDTTEIRIAAKELPAQTNILELFTKAVEEFDNENFDSACKLFEQFEGTFPRDDSLYFETKFFQSECSIYYDKFNEAENILIDLLNNKVTPPAVTEKAYVRLGQLYCVTNKESLANEMFITLKKEFPASKYLRIANCDIVRQ